MASTPKKSFQWISKNGQFLRDDQDQKIFLRTYPRGAYTTMRTVNKTSVLEWSFHVNRLVTSVSLMMGTDKNLQLKQKLQRFLDAKSLCSLLESQLSSSVRALTTSHRIEEQDELKICMLLTPQESSQDENLDVYMHFSLLPGRPKPPIKVTLEYAHRDNPLAKDSNWVKQYEEMEAKKPADVNEIVMVGPDNTILEGLSSNFFAVMNGAVYTADQGILPGTIRDVLLSVCRKHQIPVVLQGPKLSDVQNWEGALIASTSRLALPVHEISANDQSGDKLPHRTFQYNSSSLTLRLENLVLAAISEKSEKALADVDFQKLSHL